MSHKNRKLFFTSERTTRAVEKLLTLQQGQIMPYAELSKVIGLDPQTEPGRRYIASARRIILHQHGRVCDCVVDVGVKWLTESETAQVGSLYIRKARRAAGRGIRKSRCVVDPSTLSRDDRVALTSNMTMLAIVQFSASEKELTATRRRMSDHAIPAQAEPADFANT